MNKLKELFHHKEGETGKAATSNTSGGSPAGYDSSSKTSGDINTLHGEKSSGYSTGDASTSGYTPRQLPGQGSSSEYDSSNTYGSTGSTSGTTGLSGAGTGATSGVAASYVQKELGGRSSDYSSAQQGEGYGTTDQSELDTGRSGYGTKTDIDDSTGVKSTGYGSSEGQGYSSTSGQQGYSSTSGQQGYSGSSGQQGYSSSGGQDSSSVGEALYRHSKDTGLAESDKAAAVRRYEAQEGEGISGKMGDAVQGGMDKALNSSGQTGDYSSSSRSGGDYSSSTDNYGSTGQTEYSQTGSTGLASSGLASSGYETTQDYSTTSAGLGSTSGLTGTSGETDLLSGTGKIESGPAPISGEVNERDPQYQTILSEITHHPHADAYGQDISSTTQSTSGYEQSGSGYTGTSSGYDNSSSTGSTMGAIKDKLTGSSSTKDDYNTSSSGYDNTSSSDNYGSTGTSGTQGQSLTSRASEAVSGLTGGSTSTSRTGAYDTSASGYEKSGSSGGQYSGDNDQSTTSKIGQAVSNATGYGAGSSSTGSTGEHHGTTSGTLAHGSSSLSERPAGQSSTTGTSGTSGSHQSGGGGIMGKIEAFGEKLMGKETTQEKSVGESGSKNY